MANVYKHITKEEAECGHLTEEQFADYNNQVDILNATIDAYQQLREKCEVDDFYLTEKSLHDDPEYQELYHRHCAAYEKYMALQEELLYNSGKDLLDNQVER